MYHPSFLNMENVQIQVDFVKNKRGPPGQSLVLWDYMYRVSTLLT